MAGQFLCVVATREKRGGFILQHVSRHGTLAGAADMLDRVIGDGSSELSAVLAADARKVWLGLLDVECREGVANRGCHVRAKMRKAAADFWRMRRMARELAILKPEKVRKGDRDILAGDVLCPTGAITDAYTAWLSAWQEANPDRNVDQTGQADWLNEQKRGGAFRYDGEA